MIPKIRLIAPALIFAGLASFAQSFGQSTASPKLEVAAIRPCKPSGSPSSERGGVGGNHPGTLRIVCQTVERLIQFAYVAYASGQPFPIGAPRPPEQRIEGGPAWVRNETFTLEAKPESPQSMEMMRGPMLRALLENRFQLKVHPEMKQVPIYALVVAKGSAKLNAAKKDSCTPPPDFSKGVPPRLTPDQAPPCGAFSPDGKGGTRTYGQTMAGLSMQFSALLDRHVVDRTGIEGAYDIHLDVNYNDVFTRFDRPSAEGDALQRPQRVDPVGALGSAVRKLGLRLESTRGPEAFLVIDSVERPSDN